MKPHEGKHETPEMRFSLFQVRNTVPLPDVLSKNNTQLFAWRQDKGSHLGFSQVCVLYDNMELKACLWATQAAALVPFRLAWVGRKSEPRGWRRGP